MLATHCEVCDRIVVHTMICHDNHIDSHAHSLCYVYVLIRLYGRLVTHVNIIEQLSYYVSFHCCNCMIHAFVNPTMKYVIVRRC